MVNRKKIRWFLGIGVQIFMVSMAIKSCEILYENSGILTCWIHTFSGIPQYVRSQDTQFELPVLWILFQAYILFMVCDCTTEEIQGFGLQKFLRSGSRKKWMFSQNLKIIRNVVCYYLQYFVILFLGTCSKREKWSFETEYRTEEIVFWITITILPVITTATLALCQNLFSILIKPFQAYIISLGLLIISAYKQNEILIGNYAMFLRNEVFCEGGLSTWKGVVICSLVAIAAIVGCGRLMEHYDVV